MTTSVAVGKGPCSKPASLMMLRRTQLELTAGQLDTFRLIATLAALTYGICLLLVIAAMWRIRPHSHTEGNNGVV